jgi:putative flippase GtrA
VTGHNFPILVRWLKFNYVGGIGIAVQFAVLFGLKGVLHFDYRIATALAVELTVMHNFIWHERFTWVDRTRNDQLLSSPRNWPARLLRFNLSNGTVSLVGNLALMRWLVGAGQVNYLLANGIAIVLCSLVNFLVSEEWVFQ